MQAERQLGSQSNKQTDEQSLHSDVYVFRNPGFMFLCKSTIGLSASNSPEFAILVLAMPYVKTQRF